MTGVEVIIALVWFAWCGVLYTLGYQDGKKEGRREGDRLRARAERVRRWEHV